ncbi:MAG: VapB-type antitoxin [Candidatus Brockarchaeota archaeon]|nr:VapB-type antitoxin [Candidatus Brockarchaeota archaeon]MBO3809079.1 VapB-type antitoxin [Candidatus Brockarchaeota archaeon]MBO3841060.1 VapB-type antitoxin [Candidatus Brockarchaeota archaeon]
MTSTIQVKRRNLRLLEALKKRMGVKSYDEVIERLLEEKTNIPADMFGVDKGRISKFTEKDRLEDRD